jgi:peptide/nickel transport system substrate-binding protein
MTNASFDRWPAAVHAPRRRTLLVLCTALALGAVGCGDARNGRAEAPEGEVGGTVVIAIAADPGTLMPPLASGTAAQAVNAQIFEHLAEIGDSLNAVNDAGFEPRVAERWTWAADSMSIAFHVDPRARWHDGRPVRAEDVRFTFDVYADPAVGSSFRSALSNIDSVSATDSLTAVFWYKRRSPVQFFDAVYHIAILPSHLLVATPRAAFAESPFARNPVGSGQFRFVRWDAGQQVELAAVAEHYRQRPNLDRVIWSIAPDHNSAAIKLFSGEADFYPALRPDNFAQIASNQSLKLAPYASLEYGILQFNLRANDGSRRPHPIFGDRAMRRALTMAVDRARLVQNVFDTLGYAGIGPVPRALYADWPKLRQIPFDVARSRQIMDSLGWVDADGDGVRERAGVPLEFSVLVPTSSAPRRRYAVLLQDQFKQLGARLRIEELEINAIGPRLGTRRFDAFMGGWVTNPSRSGARQTWGSAAARQAGGSNFGSYESAEFDAAVDDALTSLDPTRSDGHWGRAYQIIIDDAPAIWLYEPRLVAGAHRRLQLTGMRADGWWNGIGGWSIPRGERIARDRSGVAN